MIRVLILALAVLHVSDPVADAIGDGSLAPPTAPVYASTANFDLQEVVLTDDPTLTLRITMGALDNPGSLALGFSNAVIEVYMDTAPGGAEALLPGSGMRMPSGTGWEYAMRLTGDEAYLVTAQEEGTPEDWGITALDVTTDGTTLIVESPLPRPRHADLYALTGVYDAFGPQPWRAVAATPSPWAFSSPTQTLPVIDLLAPNQADQARALQTGTFPQPNKPAYGVGWLLLMLAGLVAAIVGLVFRRKAGLRQARPEVPAATPHATRSAAVSAGAAGVGSAPPTSMWGDGKDLPLPRAPRRTASEGGTSSDEATDQLDPEQAGASADSQRSANVPAEEPVGAWQDVLVPSYSVRPTLPNNTQPEHGLGASQPDDTSTAVDGGPDADIALEADGDPDADVALDSDVVLDADFGADADGVLDADGETVSDVEPDADWRQAAPNEGPEAQPQTADATLHDARKREDHRADAAPRGNDDADLGGRAKPFVPIVPLPAGPPLRRSRTGAPVTPSDDVTNHGEMSTKARSEVKSAVDRWAPFLVDPHDTFLDEPRDEDEAVFWPTVRAVHGRTNPAPASHGDVNEGPEAEDAETVSAGTEGPETESAEGESPETVSAEGESAEAKASWQERPEHEDGPRRHRDDDDAVDS